MKHVDLILTNEIIYASPVAVCDIRVTCKFGADGLIFQIKLKNEPISNYSL